MTGADVEPDAARFAELMQENELLAKENRLFDSYLHRYEQNQTEDESAYVMAKRAPAVMPHPVISQYQRYNIAIQEHDYRQSQYRLLEQKSDDDISLLVAIIEGIKIRVDEMRKETYEFKRDIVVGAENTRTGHIMAEKVLRFFEQKLKEKTALMDKIKLKNAAYKNARAKMDAQVKHKEEQGDSLHSIDFHQLQIENSQFIQKINERNNLLLKLKMTTGNTVHLLNSTKRNLNALLTGSKQFKREIRERENALTRLTDELAKVETELRGARKKNKMYKIQQSNPDMPQVMDYVNQKSEMFALQAEVRNWERKCEIISMAAKQSRHALAQLEPYLQPR